MEKRKPGGEAGPGISRQEPGAANGPGNRTAGEPAGQTRASGSGQTDTAAGNATAGRSADSAAKGATTEQTADSTAASTAGGRTADTSDENTTAGTSGQASRPSTDEKQKAAELELLRQCLETALMDGKRLSGEKQELERALEEKEALLSKLNGRLRQVVDEYDNYRRRAAEEKKAAFTDAVCKAVTALLPALDSLERALPFAGKNPESFRQGVEMTLGQLEEGFRKLGVEEIDTPVGAAFDPDLHNAVMHVQDDSAGESVVAEVFQKGYQVAGKVIRHSVVKVAN